MARRVMGRYYKVETNVYATLRGFSAGTGFKGCKMVHIDIVEGTETLFTPDKFPARLSDIREGDYPATQFFKGNTIAEIAQMPQEVKDRYRLGDHHFVVLRFLPATYWNDTFRPDELPTW